MSFGETVELGVSLKLDQPVPSTLPVLVSAPTLVGPGLVGGEIVVQPGVWKGEPAPALTLQWLCDGTPVPGATRLAFTPGDAEDGAAVACRVTASNAAGEAVAETEAVEIVRIAPVAIGVLADVVLAQGGAVRDVQTVAFFAGDALQFSIAGTGAAIDPETGVVTLSPLILRAGEIITVTAKNSGGAATSSFAVTVLAVPTAAGVPAPVVLAQGAGNATIATAAYFAGSALVYALEGAPAAATINASTGVVTLAIGAALTTSLKVRATNAVGAATQSFAVTVLAVPSAAGVPAPVVLAQGAGNATIATAAYFTGSALVYALEGAPAAAVINASTGVVTLATGAALTASLRVRATNAVGTATQSVAVTVLAVPSAAGVPAPVVLAQGAGNATIATAAYFTGSALVYALEGAPAAAVINASTGVVTLATGAALTASLRVRATNAVGTATQSVAVTVLAPILVVGSNNTGGPATSVSGLVAGDDVFVVVRRTGSTSAPLAPTGSSLAYRILATATGATSVARMFHVKVTAAMLTGGVFATGSFANAGTSRTYIAAMRNVASITNGVATGGLRTARPFSAVPGLSALANVVGFAFAGAGVPPTPAEATILQDSVGRLWRAGPTATWSPTAGAAGSNVDWLEMAVGLNR